MNILFLTLFGFFFPKYHYIDGYLFFLIYAKKGLVLKKSNAQELVFVLILTLFDIAFSVHYFVDFERNDK